MVINNYVAINNNTPTFKISSEVSIIYNGCDTRTNRDEEIVKVPILRQFITEP